MLRFPEFDFLAAVEETGSLNLDLSVNNSSSINLLAKKKQKTARLKDANVSIWKPDRSTSPMHMHRKRQERKLSALLQLGRTH